MTNKEKSSSTQDKDITQKFSELKNFYESGCISEEEYKAKKSDLLAEY